MAELTPYRGFRQSTNIDDRRDTSEAAEWARALLAAMVAEPPMPTVLTPLGVAAGASDLDRIDGLEQLKAAIYEQRAADRLARRKLPFGLGG